MHQSIAHAPLSLPPSTTRPAAAQRNSPLLRDLAALLLAYALTRLALSHHLKAPVFGWRPSDIASIALNYYRNGFHFLTPQVSWGGAGEGYVEMEFPLMPFLTALLYRIFGVREELNDTLPIVVGFGIVWLTYLIGRQRFDARVGLAAGLVVVFSPTLMMLTNTGGYADPPMILAATAGLYFLSVWSENGRLPLLLASAACVALAILLKLTALYVGIPMLWLFWRRYRSSLLKRPLVWLTLGLTLLPSVLWYWYAHRLFLAYHNTFGIWGGYTKFGTSAILTDRYFYLMMVKRVALYHLTLLPSFACGVGFYLLVRRREWFMLVWLASVVLYLLVAAVGVSCGHYHYMLPLLPVLALAAGVGAGELTRIAEQLVQDWPKHMRVAGALTICLALIATDLVSGYRFEFRERSFDSWMWNRKKVTGEHMKALTSPDSLLIVVDDQMDSVQPSGSMTPPDVFYFSDRRGWYQSMAWLTPERIEALRAEGAANLVVSGQSIEAFKRLRVDILEYLTANYRKIMDDEAGLAFALR